MNTPSTTSIPTTLSQDDISALFTSLSPSQPRDVRTQGTVTLATYVTHTRDGKSPETATAEIVRVLAPPLQHRLSSTAEAEALQALAFFGVLFTVDPLSAAALLVNEEIRSHLADVPDIFPGNAVAETALAELLSQAAGVKACRALVREDWDEFLKRVASSGAEDSKTKALLALLKLSRGGEEGVQGEAVEPAVSEDDEIMLSRRLAYDLVNVIERKEEPLDTVEALAHLSLTPAVREALSANASFLHALLSIPRSKERVTLPVLYGISVTLSNILAYRPKLAGEDAQLDRLRRMAKGGLVKGSQKLKDEPIPRLERDDAVRERCRRLLRAGVVPALVAMTKVSADSTGVRDTVGRAFLSLVEEKDNRGTVIQAGGAKALQVIIRAGLAGPDASVLSPIQALAKLAITSSPLLLFGPTPSASIDAIRPFYVLLSHPQSSLLQQFEALMALTNLASLGPELSDRVATQSGLLGSLDQLILDDNIMVRRAAAELVCNLVSCEAVFRRYTVEPGAQGRLHVLLALSDVDDKDTRLAASGALAMLSDSPEACSALLTLPKGAENTFGIVVQLIDPSLVPQIVEIDTSVPISESDSSDERAEEQPDPGLQHRGTLLLRNLLLTTKPQPDAKVAERAGAVTALVSVLKTFGGKEGSEGMVMAAVEALKWFVQKGVKIDG
ncbi:ARM repeat-containing protein [Calocera viscosa TUFC12733]|uniref:ARM repeat-containing protein n=1 Tax=Calocera viscosa (strain TUFC12733) TaxID=1330018 RepID=A0A167QD49_CALVF|nr:ARM repeat-containing protein [Calocera viscosa TUFC12733]